MTLSTVITTTTSLTVFASFIYKEEGIFQKLSSGRNKKVRNMKKNVKPLTKGQAFSRVFGHLRELSTEQKMKFGISIQRITALVELSELILILFILALSVSGWTLHGIIVCSLLMGSFVTNMVWFVLMRREPVEDWKGKGMTKMERMTKGQAFNMMIGHLKGLYYEQKMKFGVSIQRIAALVELSELILILFILALSVSGWALHGIIICSLLVGSFVTNMVWFVLMRREIWVEE